MLESQFRALLEAAPDAMVVVDHTGVIVLVNGQTERLFGYSRDELVGERVEVLVPARFRMNHVAQRGHYFRQPAVREMGSRVELNAVRRDGSEFPVEISLSPLETEDGLLVTSAIRDITERKKAREKELLLTEIHHRVKNNLQIISSLLKLHAERVGIPEARAAFEDAQQRVRAIAILHESLFEMGQRGPVDFGVYARSLVDSLARAAAADVRVSVRVVNLELSLDQALPCGLIVNELVTNSFKHAFAQHEGEKWLEVTAERAGEDVVVEVRDNGVGFPERARDGSLGMHLVRTLARQLRGEVSFVSDSGARARLVFPSARARSDA